MQATIGRADSDGPAISRQTQNNDTKNRERETDLSDMPRLDVDHGKEESSGREGEETERGRVGDDTEMARWGKHTKN